MFSFGSSDLDVLSGIMCGVMMLDHVVVEVVDDTQDSCFGFVRQLFSATGSVRILEVFDDIFFDGRIDVFSFFDQEHFISVYFIGVLLDGGWKQVFGL